MSVKSCKCKECVGACETRPCWGTIEDAERLIDAGFASRLMCDYWYGDGPDGDDIQLLCPAVVGYEDGPAPETSFMLGFFGDNPFGRCTFLTKDNLCEVHKIKPLEGRRALPCKEPRGFGQKRHKRVAMQWNNKKGRALVKRWNARCDKGEEK